MDAWTIIIVSLKGFQLIKQWVWICVFVFWFKSEIYLNGIIDKFVENIS